MRRIPAMRVEMVDDAGNTEHAAADELLPWYVNGTLSADEHAMVRRHLDVCEACSRNVALLSRVDAVVNRPAATPILPPRRPDALLARIDSEGRSAARRWSAPALAAAASLAIVAAGFLLWPDPEAGAPERPVFETVTSVEDQATMEYVMRLEFEAGVRPEDRRRVLAELEGRDARYDAADGAYQVNVTLAAASLEELTRFTTAVEGLPEVRSARIVALQLPMQRESGQGDR